MPRRRIRRSIRLLVRAIALTGVRPPTVGPAWGIAVAEIEKSIVSRG